jgi:hypothetical protein
MEVKMSKQTAVEWLEQAYWDNKGTLSQKHFEQAKQMEEEQIEDAYDMGYLDYQNLTHDSSKEYFNETYGNG